MVNLNNGDGDTRRRGSIEYFRDEWRKQKDSESFIFPRDEPRTQWDAFESIKAQAMLKLIRNRVGNSGRVLEFGCGAAGILIFLTNHGFEGVALDATAEALHIASANDRNERSAQQPTPLSLVNANAFAMPFQDATFDCVLSNGLLEHFAPEVVPALLNEIVRTLKPGGLFLSDIAHSRFSTRQIAMPANFITAYSAKIMRRQGFGIRDLWRAVKQPMYENSYDRGEWEKALTSAGMMNVDIRGFRLLPPLSLPTRIDRLYGRAILSVSPFRWANEVHSRSIPLGWVYLATGTRAQCRQ